MKKWIVRLASLTVFNIVVLVLVGLLVPGVSVGWSVLWASLLLTLATIWLKPAITALFRSLARRGAAQRSPGRERLIRYLLVFAVAFVVWLVVVAFSGVHVSGWFWGYLLPPVALLIAWAIYDAIDDRLEGYAGGLYDRAVNKDG